MLIRYCESHRDLVVLVWRVWRGRIEGQRRDGHVPLSGDLLCGVLKKEANQGRRSREPLQKSIDTLRPQLEQYEALCNELGHAPADVALAWILAQPGVTAPIVGPRTLQRLQQNIAALELTLSQETLDALNQIWPGPGNQAPEAYAW